jgi:hypothetical protein
MKGWSGTSVRQASGVCAGGGRSRRCWDDVAHGRARAAHGGLRARGPTSSVPRPHCVPPAASPAHTASPVYAAFPRRRKGRAGSGQWACGPWGGWQRHGEGPSGGGVGGGGGVCGGGGRGGGQRPCGPRDDEYSRRGAPGLCVPGGLSGRRVWSGGRSGLPGNSQAGGAPSWPPRLQRAHPHSLHPPAPSAPAGLNPRSVTPARGERKRRRSAARRGASAGQPFRPAPVGGHPLAGRN